MIPQEFINDLIQRSDIVKVVGAKVRLRSAGKTFKGLCPFHQEKTPSFVVYPESNSYHCFGCGANGTTLGFLIDSEGYTFVEAVETLARDLGLEVPRERGGPRFNKTDEQCFAILDEAASYYHSTLQRGSADDARSYTVQRGLSDETINDFRIGFALPQWDGLKHALDRHKEQELVDAGLLKKSDSDHTYDCFRNRLMFPIRDVRGRVVGFGGRVIDPNDTPKYLNSPDTPVFHKSRELYGLYEARKWSRRLDRVVLVEGYMDVVVLAQHGIRYAVASLGTSTNTDHFTLLYRYTDEVVCCFDGDDAGRQAAWRALENAFPLLQGGRRLKFVMLSEGHDPDSLVRQQGSDAFEEALTTATPSSEYFIEHLSLNRDLNSDDDCVDIARKAVPLIQSVPDNMLRDKLYSRLSEKTGISRQALDNSTLGRGRSQKTSRTPRQPVNLERRLLQLLVKQPSVANKVAQSSREDLKQLMPESLLTLVMQKIEEHKIDSTVLLWDAFVGEPSEQVLLKLAETDSIIQGEALVTAFTDGFEVLLTRQQRSNREGKLRESNSLETFRSVYKKTKESGSASSSP